MVPSLAFLFQSLIRGTRGAHCGHGHGSQPCQLCLSPQHLTHCVCLSTLLPPQLLSPAAYCLLAPGLQSTLPCPVDGR